MMYGMQLNKLDLQFSCSATGRVAGFDGLKCKTELINGALFYLKF